MIVLVPTFDDELEADTPQGPMKLKEAVYLACRQAGRTVHAVEARMAWSHPRLCSLDVPGRPDPSQYSLLLALTDLGYQLALIPPEEQS